MFFSPHSSTCPGCGRAFTAGIQLIVNLNQGIPDFMREGRPPFHDCTSCNARIMITAPLLVLNFAGNPPTLREPPLIFVPAEGSDQKSAQEDLRYLVGKLKSVSGKAWDDGMLDRLVVMDRKRLAKAFR